MDSHAPGSHDSFGGLGSTTTRALGDSKQTGLHKNTGLRALCQWGYNITDQYHRIGVISICIIRLCMCLTRVAAPSCQSLKSCAPELAGRQSRAAYITWKVIGPYRSRQSCELDWCGLPLHSPLCDCCPQYAQPVIMSHMLTNFSNGHCPQIFVAVPDNPLIFRRFAMAWQDHVIFSVVHSLG